MYVPENQLSQRHRWVVERQTQVAERCSGWI